MVDYLLTPDDQFVKADGSVDVMAAPFVPADSTPLDRGIAACASTMVMNRDKIRGALTICILDGDPNGSSANNITNNWLSRRDGLTKHILNQTGAATQLITSWDYDNYGTIGSVRRGADWNPSGNPAMWLNDERLRREFGPVLYIIVGSGDSEASVQSSANRYNATLMNYYNGTNYGVLQRSRDTPDGSREYETEIALGTDSRNGRAVGNWSAWHFIYQPPAGLGVSSLDASEWNAPSIRGPCQACSQSCLLYTSPSPRDP